MTGQDLYALMSPNNNLAYHKGKRQWPVWVAISTKEKDYWRALAGTYE